MIVTPGEGIEFLETSAFASILDVRAEVLRRWIRQGTFPSVRVGKCWLVQQDELKRWIAEQPHRVATKGE